MFKWMVDEIMQNGKKVGPWEGTWLRMKCTNIHPFHHAHPRDAQFHGARVLK
jgi:hypothetical protein